MDISIDTTEADCKVSRVIGNNDIITIELSLQTGNVWGDYARTIIVENGNVVNDIEMIEHPEWKSGLQMEEDRNLLPYSPFTCTMIK